MGMKTIRQFRRRWLGFKLFIIFQAVKLCWCYMSYSQSWRAQSWSGVRLLVYIKAYNKSVWTNTLEVLWFMGKLCIFFPGTLRMGEDIQKPVIQSVLLGRWERLSILWGSLSGKQYFSGKIITLSLKNKLAENLKTGVKQRDKDLSLRSCSSPVWLW